MLESKNLNYSLMFMHIVAAIKNKRNWITIKAFE